MILAIDEELIMVVGSSTRVFKRRSMGLMENT